MSWWMGWCRNPLLVLDCCSVVSRGGRRVYDSFIAFSCSGLKIRFLKPFILWSSLMFLELGGFPGCSVLVTWRGCFLLWRVRCERWTAKMWIRHTWLSLQRWRQQRWSPQRYDRLHGHLNHDGKFCFNLIESTSCFFFYGGICRGTLVIFAWLMLNLFIW